MKLSIRTLDQKTISLELQDEKQNVLQLKQQLVKLPEITQPVESLQLIYAGSIMQDDLPLTNYNIVENKFIVLMSKKQQNEGELKGQPNGAELKGQPNETELKGPQAEVKMAEEKKEVKKEELKKETDATALPASSQIVTPSLAPDEQRVRDLINMGYEEQEVRAALRASFNHPERAIEYLITGIPCQENSLPSPTAAVDAGSAVSDTAERLQYLATSPRFAHVRDMIRQNPELLELVLQHLSETDPSTFEAIRSHQEEFVAMLNAPLAVPTPDTVTLSSEEEAAVERLMALGFDRETVVQVYLACDKNEELSAQLLFSQSDEDDDDNDDHELNYE